MPGLLALLRPSRPSSPTPAEAAYDFDAIVPPKECAKGEYRGRFHGNEPCSKELHSQQLKHDASKSQHYQSC